MVEDIEEYRRHWCTTDQVAECKLKDQTRNETKVGKVLQDTEKL